MRDTHHTLFRASRTAPRAAIAAMLLAIACGLGGCAGGGAQRLLCDGRRRQRHHRGVRIDRRPAAAGVRPHGRACSTANRSCATCRSSPAKDQASYRVRSYLAAQVSRGRTTIAWVWDVYDRNQQRALRLSGEEPAGKAGRDAWAAADDLVLRKIAQAGFSGLTAMINGTAPADAPPPAPAPGQARPGGRERRTSPRRPRERLPASARWATPPVNAKSVARLPDFCAGKP